MKHQTIKHPFWLYVAFILVAVFSFTFDTSAQTIERHAAGNYRQISARNDSTGANYKDTGKTFTNTKGETFPVMISNKGKLFVIRTSKTGNQYRQYLKP